MPPDRERTEDRKRPPRPQARTSTANDRERTHPKHACERCLARSKLLERLNVRLDYSCRDATRQAQILALDDAALIYALGGRKREELSRLHRHFEPSQIESCDDVKTCCAHHPGGFPLPRSMLGALFMRGDPTSLSHEHEPLASPPPTRTRSSKDSARTAPVRMSPQAAPRGVAPIVAILGAKLATDYGCEVARSLAVTLATAGIAVVSTFAEGIGAAALSGVLDAGRAPLAVMQGGIATIKPQHLRSLGQRIANDGVAISQTPPLCQPRRWGARAAMMLASKLAQVSVIVEARAQSLELDVAETLAREGDCLAAAPGRLSAPASHGSNLLIKRGEATMLTSARDVFELLYRHGDCRDRCGDDRYDAISAYSNLDHRLQLVIDRIESGEDTFGKLTADAQAAKTLLALAQLEALGALTRDVSGRYGTRLSLGGA